MPATDQQFPIEQPFDGEDNKHHAARDQADAALRKGNADQFNAATHADPEAAEAALEETDKPLPEDLAPQDDEELAAMSRTIQPHSDAPSRAGISDTGAGGGSGADDE